MSAQRRSGGATIRIDLAERSYDVVVGSGALRSLGERAAALVTGRRALLEIDNEVPPEVIEAAHRSLEGAGFSVSHCFIAAAESIKTPSVVEHVLKTLTMDGFDRTDVAISLGGGLTGDVVGLAASLYRRGIAFVNCPTTLLSMVDASVGGKTGVNIELETGLVKNMVGTFWQPRLVIADPETLRSLPDREMRCGLAECLKHGLIAASAPGLKMGSADEHLRFVEESAGRVLRRGAEAVAELVTRNVRIKAAFVTADEREDVARDEGGRALLNLGHTFAHALEPIPTLSPSGNRRDAPLKHGEAVGLGLVAASHASAAMGRLSEAEVERICEGVRGAGLPTAVSGLPSTKALLSAMARDKKSVGDALRLVLPQGIGRASVVSDPAREVVEAGIEAIRRRS